MSNSQKDQILAQLARALESAPPEVMQQVAIQTGKLAAMLDAKQGMSTPQPTVDPRQMLAQKLEEHLMLEDNPGRKLHDIMCHEMVQEENPDPEDTWENASTEEKLYWNAAVARLGIDMGKVLSKEEFAAKRDSSNDEECNCTMCIVRRELEAQGHKH